MKRELFQFTKIALTYIIKRQTLEKWFDQSNNLWTRLPSIIDSFTSHAKASFQIEPSAANFIGARMNKSAEKWRLAEKFETVVGRNRIFMSVEPAYIDIQYWEQSQEPSPILLKGKRTKGEWA